MYKKHLTHREVNDLAIKLKWIFINRNLCNEQKKPKIYGIPRGGVAVLYLLASHLNFTPVNFPEEADIFVDDIIDSGKTKDAYYEAYPGRPFFALIDKQEDNDKTWYVFPWEAENEEASVTDNITRIIQYIGDDPNREGLLETPNRVVKALGHWFSGYNKNAKDILKVFEDGAENYDQMIVRKDIPLYSHCEHHMAPIFGKCTIAYIPDGKIVGLSKMDRLVEVFSRRLQVQERLTNQIANAMWENLKPLGVGVWINARHMCVESRGVCNSDSATITTSLKGVFLDNPSTRNEFLSLARK